MSSTMNSMNDVIDYAIKKDPNGEPRLRLMLHDLPVPLEGIVQRSEVFPDLYEMTSLAQAAGPDGRPTGQSAVVKTLFAGEAVAIVQSIEMQEITPAKRPGIVIPGRS